MSSPLLQQSGIVHVPGHLTQVHKWSHSRPRTAITYFHLWKTYAFKSKESAEPGNRNNRNSDEETTSYKDYHKKRICPKMI